MALGCQYVWVGGLLVPILEDGGYNGYKRERKSIIAASEQAVSSDLLTRGIFINICHTEL